ncbi:MAG: hypothetical protein IJD04_00890 [Desulfovibrionaceae bacterium]|nr:hypothetical protein [Desulfovibrionaceae bacterium]
MEISGLPYLAKAQEGLPFNAVVAIDRQYQVTPESVSLALMPGNQESDTMRQTPAAEAKSIEHSSNQLGLPPVIFDMDSGIMHIGMDRLNEKVPEISMYEGKGAILDHWA